MAKGKLVVICQSGGKFSKSGEGEGDGSLLSYCGGDAHAMSINNETHFDEFKTELAEMWKYDPSLITIKYFLPYHKRTLITVSNNKDLQRMIEFHENYATVDLYVMITQTPAPTSDVTTTPCSRSSRTAAVTATEPVSPRSALPDLVVDAEEIGKQNITSPWKNVIKGLDQKFNNVNDFRDALHKYSVAHGFLYTYKNNSSKRVSVKCKTEGCPWHILASKLSTTQLFRIKKMNGTHTCGVGTGKLSRLHASKKLVASIVKEKLRHCPDYRPREIINEIQQDLGIEVRYKQAWSGIETAREELQGSYKEAYNQLPWLCEKIMETNPGSVATLITKDDLSFHRIFVAFHASLYGFQNGCRPLLFLDSMTINSKYQGVLLMATALDGDDGNFPVAFAIVDVLSDDNWHWFLIQLEAALSTSQSITFVTDKRSKGISDSLSLLFQNCCHGYSLHHLTESLMDELKGSLTQEILRAIATEFYDASYAPTVDGFKKCIETINNISPNAYDWILQSEPERWANAFFQGARYNHVKSNVAESFVGWVSELPALPIAQMMYTLCLKMMELIYTRRVDSDRWSSRLTPRAEEKLQSNKLNSHPFKVSFSSGSNMYEVCDRIACLTTTNVVNLDSWGCSCREWQITGIPCLHAEAVIEHIGKNVYDFCSKYFTVEAFRLTYSECINPVPTVERPVCMESLPLHVHVHPPCVRRPLGRPKETRTRRKGVVDKRPLHCSKCKNLGHNKSTCKQSS